MTHPMIRQLERFGYPESMEIIGYCKECDDQILGDDPYIENDIYSSEYICYSCIIKMKKCAFDDLIEYFGWKWG